MVCGSLRWFVMVCRGLSYSHTLLLGLLLLLGLGLRLTIRVNTTKLDS